MLGSTYGSARRLIFDFKRVHADGSIVQIRIWRLPEPTSERPHGYKYSLFFGGPGVRIVGYDNELGKGDHRHYGSREEPYRFVSVDRLLADFDEDVAKERRRARTQDQS